MEESRGQEAWKQTWCQVFYGDNIPEKLVPLQVVTSHIAPPGARPVVSDQGCRPICTRHAVGKAIVDLLDVYGYDCNQEEVIDALDEEHTRRYPAFFNTKEITVELQEKQQKFHAKIQICVESADVELDYSNYTWKQNLVCLPRDRRMVVTWDMGTTLSHVCQILDTMTHCLFCEKFDEKTKNFCCINSWGDFNVPNPKIHSSRICF